MNSKLDNIEMDDNVSNEKLLNIDRNQGRHYQPTPLSKEVNISTVDEDLLEIIHSFEKNKDQICKLFQDGQSLRIEDLIVFKDKADDIIGHELEEFALYLSRKYSLVKSKHSIKYSELVRALKKWSVHHSILRKRDKVEDWMDENYELDDYDDLDEQKEIDVDQYRERERSKHLLELKLLNYNQRIQDIFKANGDKEDSDAEVDSDQEDPQDMQIKINRLSKVMKDIKHLIGLEFITWSDYIAGTKSDVVDRIKKVMWTEVHQAV